MALASKVTARRHRLDNIAALNSTTFTADELTASDFTRSNLCPKLYVDNHFFIAASCLGFRLIHRPSRRTQSSPWHHARLC